MHNDSMNAKLAACILATPCSMTSFPGYILGGISCRLVVVWWQPILLPGQPALRSGILRALHPRYSLAKHSPLALSTGSTPACVQSGHPRRRRFWYTREGAGVNGLLTFGLIASSKSLASRSVGSTPVLKIALPSSPLPEHRQLSRPSTRRLAPFRALSSELGSMGWAPRRRLSSRSHSVC